MPHPHPGAHPSIELDRETQLAPLYHVVLLDDQEHTYEYVIEMLVKLFHKATACAFEHAVEVDKTGRTILETTHLEKAELKRDQIKGYGGDWRLGSVTSMHSVIEQAE
ncbi:MAG: ATP-dependent Clp protease adaptor ClpS [Planctomycetes bacterium]|nr:ATP-dependent Clp protease adaptor ClpS [Planctomycetota bacterium]